MNRRNFLKGLTALVGGIALEEAIPLGRVWSFPTEIIIPSGNQLLTVSWITKECLKVLEKNLRFYPHQYLLPYGSAITIRKPQRYIINE